MKNERDTRSFSLENAPKRLQGTSNGSTAATVLGGDGMLTPSSLFFVNESSTLHLEGIALTGGRGARGGAVMACGNSSVTLVNCTAAGNSATDLGGEKLEKVSRMGARVVSEHNVNGQATRSFVMIRLQ